MDKNSFDNLQEAGSARLPAAPESSASPEFDAADYLGDLDGFDLNDAQKAELLETLWFIMGSFARMGFEVDVCGLLLGDFNEACDPASGDDRLIASTFTEKPAQDSGKEGIA